MADPRQWVRHSRDREWPDLPSPFTFAIDLSMDGFEDTHEARSAAGTMGLGLVEDCNGWRRPHFYGRLHNLAVKGAPSGEFG